MEAYTAFAKVYDRFMENVPYEKWGDFLDYTIEKLGITKPSRDADDALESERNLVLDMGCGTGVLTEIMFEKGYDMIGVDLSQDMLDVALRRKLSKYASENEPVEDEIEAAAVDTGILYLCQDMCELDLYSTVGTIYSTCDSINYLIEDDEVKACFDNVSNYLYPDGLFIFDVNTVYKYREVIGDVTIAEDTDESSFIWDNYYDEEENINEYDLTLFIKASDENSSRPLYEKYNETHYQRGFEIDEVIGLINESGLEVLAILDESVVNDDKCSYKDIIDNIVKSQAAGIATEGECTKAGISEHSERVIFIARKPA